MYRLSTTKLYDRQIEDLSPEANALLVKKITLLLENPARYKSLSGNGPQFRIRFSDRGKQKRLVYAIDSDRICLLTIIDRDKDYRELRHRKKNS